MDQSRAQVQGFNEGCGLRKRGEYTLNTPSPCEVSLNTVALYDLGLVSSSRFRSRMLTLGISPSAT